MSLGAKVESCGSNECVEHVGGMFENSAEPIQGSCGSAILDTEGLVVAFFRFQQDTDGLSVGVSAMQLRESDHEVCRGVQKFQSTKRRQLQRRGGSICWSIHRGGIRWIWSKHGNGQVANMHRTA